MKRSSRSTAARKAAKPARARSSRLTAKTTAASKTSLATANRNVQSPAKSAKRRTTAPAPRRRPALPTTAAPPLHWTETLRDGTHVIVRPIGREDAELERRFIERLSPESRRMRFLGQLKAPTEAMIRQFTDIDYEHDMAFIALVHRDGETQEIGVSRFNTSADGRTCECAVAVSDEWHNRGIATILMHHLIDVARSRGIRTMVSYDAVENNDMHQLADYLGFARKTDPDDPHMVIHTLAL